MTNKKKFRELLAAPDILVLPGVYDAFSAKMAEKAGFSGVIMGGYQVAASMLGEPDVGYVSLTEMTFSLRNICNAVTIPVVSDGDTGYGNAMNVRRMVREYENAGTAAILLEDQVWPKKCGHMEGKKVISREEHVMKIKAAAEAKKDPDLVIIGRTDARAVNGLDDALDRARSYAEAGADMLFVEAPQSLEEMKRIVSVLKPLGKPLLANMVEHGKTPGLTANDLQDIGFDAVVFPVSAIYAMAQTLMKLFAVLKQNGTTASLADTMMSFTEFNQLIGLPAYTAMEETYTVRS
ncbi:oxaloacetate decarboxylase [Megasphaera paucivorans]|uniref:2-methylisocitrate lyase n=1 Tax=Megasphaera paucivorans TaxID=349095 RepID=A0A1G9SL06_9FIRM|nr:oxaloacetate decarboxylase [Megasphaera paucivorans]SDM36099.1 methylisocitrate lyase [Megasphaera paucivorans]